MNKRLSKGYGGQSDYPDAESERAHRKMKSLATKIIRAKEKRETRAEVHDA